MTMSDSNPPKPKRRGFLFRLRMLIVLLIAGGLVFVWWIDQLAWKNRQRAAEAEMPIQEAITEIQKLGGEARSKYIQYRTAVWLEELLDDPGDPDDPIGVWSVSHVDLRYTDVTNEVLRRLEALTNLQWLNLQRTNITDAGLEHLKGLTNLESLNLTETNVTNSGLEYLQGLTKLKRLYLAVTKVSDEGVEKLQRALPECQITRYYVPR